MGLGGAIAAPRSIDPISAPPSWIACAALVNAEVTAQLGGDTPAAVRLRAYLQQAGDPATGTSAPLILRFWIDRRGVVTRIAFAPFVHAEPNDDLRALLVGRKLPQIPPRGMLLPLRLSIQVQAPEVAGS